MKKIFSICMVAVAALAVVTSCIQAGDFGIKPEDTKLVYEQEGLVSAPTSFPISPANEVLDLGALKDDDAHLINITLPELMDGQSFIFENVTLYDAANDKRFDFPVSSEGVVSKKSLQEMILSMYERNNDPHVFEAWMEASIVLGSQAIYIESEKIKVTIVAEVVKYWSLIGDFNGWGGDLNMTRLSSGIWMSDVVELEGGFKIRYGADWGVNRGPVNGMEGPEYIVCQDGNNFNVAKGRYQVVYMPAAEIITVYSADNCWSLVGDYEGTGWGKDLIMGFNGTEYVSQVFSPTQGGGGVKVRYNCGWDVNRGGTFSAFGVPFAAVPGGDNIQSGDGFRYISYNPTTEEITVNATWGVIGEVNGHVWDVDVAMYPVMFRGTLCWFSDIFEAQGGFKIRWAGGWEVNRGGTFSESGVPFTAVAGGDNISVPAGNYTLSYNPSTEEITIVKVQ